MCRALPACAFTHTVVRTWAACHLARPPSWFSPCQGCAHAPRPARSALARKNGYTLAYNQEIVGLGLANFAGAMFSSYTTTGSFSRSAVNNASGGAAPGAAARGLLPGVHQRGKAQAWRAGPGHCIRRQTQPFSKLLPALLRPPAGARTQLAGFVTSMVVMMVLLFLTPVFSKL